MSDKIICGLANFDEVEIEERAVGVHTDVKHLPWQHRTLFLSRKTLYMFCCVYYALITVYAQDVPRGLSRMQGRPSGALYCSAWQHRWLAFLWQMFVARTLVGWL